MTREEQYMRALWALVDAIDGFKRGGATGVAVENYDNALAMAREVLHSPVASAEKSHTVCIGWTTIRRLAAEGMVYFDDVGVGLVAADDLFRCGVEPVASAALDLNETRPCVCGCRRSKHMGDGVDGECADCMGYCKKYQPAVASAAPASGGCGDECDECNGEGIVTRAFAVPHDQPCDACQGTGKASGGGR